MIYNNLEDYIGSKDMLLTEALQKIDNNTSGVLLIVDNEKFIGALSDGDIRRWLIRTGDLQSRVESAMNPNPVSVTENEEQDVYNVMEKYNIRIIPVVDSEKRILRIYQYKIGEETKYFEKNGIIKDVPVVVMAGGKGKRLYPYTKVLPKPLIPVGEKPIIEHIVDQFFKFGCLDYYFIVNHKKNMIKAYFGEIEKEYNTIFVDEEKPLGTGGGLGLLKGQIEKTFILTNCDILIKEDFSKIYKYHKDNENAITMICSLKNFTIPYGIVKMGDGGAISSMEEKPTLSFFTNTGCYIVEPEVLNDIPENVEIGFPDIIEKYRLSGKKVGVYPISEKSWLDMGQIDTLEDMRRQLEIGE